MNWLRLLPAGIVVALIAVFAVLLLRAEPPPDDPLVGQPVPEFDLAVLDGRSGYDKDTAAGPYLLNIWGSWCPPCVAEHPVLMALEAEGIPIYGIAWRDSVANANAFLDQRGDPFAGVLRDPMGEAVIALGVTGAPETFVVGRDGLIRARWAGPLTAEALERVIYPALDAG
ncbi:DsbE family thiol:disulfide interchange protein [Hyphobacterium marinum]|uniref:DsbE family thiol:disulfide interchange protein n=1 Tax=Hyphobacterium marinum TaxID=3116574 RepID=A0ABU7LWG9_9PROT|nr:DsbE family thiol:disulfide interchange protein [Hyphobacterium sp. Y6023]MEE2565540.1 DsbE family thiol:disulfide interchange protein [Hyphobacterium sp. Y6023]